MTHSNGGSGSLGALTTSDGTTTTGSVTGTSVSAHFFPLAGLNAGFTTPAGPTGWTSLELTLSFHAPGQGWVEGRAFRAGGAVAVQQAFTITP